MLFELPFSNNDDIWQASACHVLKTDILDTLTDDSKDILEVGGFEPVTNAGKKIPYPKIDDRYYILVISREQCDGCFKLANELRRAEQLQPECEFNLFNPKYLVLYNIIKLKKDNLEVKGCLEKDLEMKINSFPTSIIYKHVGEMNSYEGYVPNKLFKMIDENINIREKMHKQQKKLHNISPLSEDF
jgi:thioredoxin-related protein